MAQLTVRNVDDSLVRLLKQRAALHGHSAEAEHRRILKEALLGGILSREDFLARAAASRARLRSGIDSTDVIRADRDRDMTR